MNDEDIRLYQFQPIVNGEPLTTEDGEPVHFEIEAPVDYVDSVKIQTSVDGKVIDGSNKYLLPDKAYDILKWVGLLFLPTMAWVYTMLAGAWNLPYAQEIPFTLNVLGTMVAVLIGASSLNSSMKGSEDARCTDA